MDSTRDRREWILRLVDLNLVTLAVLLWITVQGTLATHPNPSPRGGPPNYDDPEKACLLFLFALVVGLVAFLVGGSARLFAGPAHLWNSAATPSPAKCESFNVLSQGRPSRHGVPSIFTLSNVCVALLFLGLSLLVVGAIQILFGYIFLLGATILAGLLLPRCTIRVELADGQVSRVYRVFGLAWQEAVGRGPLQVVTVKHVTGKGGGYFMKVVTAQGEVVSLVPYRDGFFAPDKARELATSWAEVLKIPLRTPPCGYIELNRELATLTVD